MSEALRSVHDAVLIDPQERDTVSLGGIHIPETAAKDAYCEGIVISAPERYQTQKGAWIECSCIKPGDRVLYYNFDAKRLHRKDGSKVHVVRYTDVCGVVE